MAEARCAVAFQFTMNNEGLSSLFINRTVLKHAFDKLLKSFLSRCKKFARTYSKIAFPFDKNALYFLMSLVFATYYGNISLVVFFVDLIQKFFIATPTLIKPFLSCLFFSCFLWFSIGFIFQLIIRAVIYSFTYKLSTSTGDNYNKKSLVSMFQAQFIQKIFQKNDSLIGLQRCLPRISVPNLQKTVNEVIETCKPVMNDEDLKDLKQMAKDFISTSGPVLQKYLILKSWIANNYVSDWWEKFVYLRGRSPIVINSNYYGLDSWHQPIKDQVKRGSYLIKSLFLMKNMIYNEQIKPILHQGIIPQCSNQYKRIFNTCRIPGKQQDYLLHFPQSDYVVVLHNGRYFKVIVEHDDVVAEVPDIEKALKSIIEDKSEASFYEKRVAALTSWNRTDWHNVRDQYFSIGTNCLTMDIIERAAFIVILENFPMECNKNSEELTKFAYSCIAGNGYDRWFDKSFNAIVYLNGTCGFNVEHSWADAPIFSHLLEYCLVISQRSDISDKTDQIRPLFCERLRWEFVTELTESIDLALKDFQCRIDDLDLIVTVHDVFGKGLIKKCNCSPDAFIQIALQMSYYKEMGKFDLTYESSMTRLFRDGRTETVRSCTNESCLFVLSMLDVNETNEKRIKLFRSAAEKHVSLYRHSMIGLGLDRHLFALYVMSRFFNMKVPFLEKVLSEPWRLSTSQTPLGLTGEVDYNKNPHLSSAGGGFGPVADDGYGVSYIIAGDHQISFHISSKKSCPKTDSKRFTQHIFTSMTEIKNLILSDKN